jgi:hypothetical protein
MKYLKSFNESKDELLYHEISFNDFKQRPLSQSISDSDNKFIKGLIDLVILKQEASYIASGEPTFKDPNKFAEVLQHKDSVFLRFGIMWNRITYINNIKSYSSYKKNSLLICKDSDDYYYLSYMTSEKSGMKTYSYKCDQLEGLNQCLNFVLNNK